MNLSIYLSIYLANYLSIYLSIYLSVYLSVYLSNYLILLSLLTLSQYFLNHYLQKRIIQFFFIPTTGDNDNILIKKQNVWNRNIRMINLLE